MNVSQFKAKCFAVLVQVSETGTPAHHPLRQACGAGCAASQDNRLKMDWEHEKQGTDSRRHRPACRRFG